MEGIEKLKKQLKYKIRLLEEPKRRALSSRFPFLKKPIISLRVHLTFWRNWLLHVVNIRNNKDFFDNVVVRHQSLLMRKLGDSTERLQRQKILNLSVAGERLNGIIIPPGRVFSFWHIVGKPTFGRGFTTGMLLSNGEVVEGMGGGLCQMSNLLYWMFLHAPVEIIQRYHHSKDVFPDSGRVLPFGSGATILYNFVDLKVRNISDTPLQLKIWLTDQHLKGQLLAEDSMSSKFHVFEKEHFFVKYKNKYYRYNEIWQEEKKQGKIIKTQKVITNFAPVLYDVTDKYLRDRNYDLIEFE